MLLKTNRMHPGKREDQPGILREAYNNARTKEEAIYPIPMNCLLQSLSNQSTL
jgi:hypothetical protein